MNKFDLKRLLNIPETFKTLKIFIRPQHSRNLQNSQNFYTTSRWHHSIAFDVVEVLNTFSKDCRNPSDDVIIVTLFRESFHGPFAETYSSHCFWLSLSYCSCKTYTRMNIKVELFQFSLILWCKPVFNPCSPIRCHLICSIWMDLWSSSFRISYLCRDARFPLCWML